MEGSISLVLSSNSIDFDEIDNNISLKPSKIIYRGQNIALNCQSLEDRWIYSVDFIEDNFIEKLNEILFDIEPNCCYLKKLIKKANIQLNFYLNSEMGQMGFELNRDQIDKIHKMGIGMNFNILSFGLVEQ